MVLCFAKRASSNATDQKPMGLFGQDSKILSDAYELSEKK